MPRSHTYAGQHPALKLSKSVYCKEMRGLIGAGNNPMVGMTVAVAVAIEEASK